MKKTMLSFAALVSFAAAAFAGGDGWLTSYDEALATAAKENRPILVDFTGSDWCGWCIKLDKDTFSKPEWASFAKDNVVLLKVDFPQRKQLAAEQQKANDALQQKFGVQGFPTLVLLNSKGKEIARNSGYLPGGPDALIAWIKSKTK